MHADKPAIKVDMLRKEFKVPHERFSSLKSTILHISKRDFERYKVLDDISFEVRRGEFFGILGRNGSGKSTLLKILAGIYSPTSGGVTVNGTLTPFIELGVGFNPELTGRENVFLNGAILGLTEKQIKQKYDEIVSFAELERFMDQKLKNYSSGMQVRLAFSIAIQAHNAILLIDEVLAVGDMAFQKKCIDFFIRLKADKAKTVVFISHDMGSVRRFCDRAIMIDDGRVVAGDKTQDVIDTYIQMNIEKLDNKKPFGSEGAKRTARKQCVIRSVSMVHEKEQGYTIQLELYANENVRGIVPGVIVRNEHGIMVSANNTRWDKIPDISMGKGQSVRCNFSFKNHLEKGQYLISANVVDGADMETFIDWSNDVVAFAVDRPYITGGVLFAEPTVEYEVIG